MKKIRGPGYLFYGAMAVVVCGLPCPALWAGPSIVHFAPLAVQPGKSTVVTFSGSGLQSASNLWFSGGGTARRISNTNSEGVSFEVNCPAEARGIQAVQLYGPEGGSNFRLVLVDSLGLRAENGAHHSRTNALRLVAPGAADMTAEAEKVDYFVFAAATGEKVSIEAIAHRIGSEMDPVVEVLDAEGKELLGCDDEPGVWRDARFVFTAPHTGEYTLAVHDAGYGGGSGFFYRLRVTHEPLVWYTYPLTDANVAGAMFETVGAGIPAEPSGSPANPTERARFSARPEMVELEPNDSAGQAQALPWPVTVNGRMDRPNDVDVFRFSAGKEDKLVFQSATRALGSPCDLALAIKTPDGKMIAQSDSNLPSDAAVTNQFKEGGEYVLEVRELSGNAAPGAPYRIQVQRFQSGVELSAEENRFEAAPGSSITIKVKCIRHDFSGAVRLEMSPPIEGMSLESAELPENKNEVEVKVKLGEGMSVGFLAQFKLRGIASSGASALVSTGPALHKEFPLLLVAPAALEDVFSVAVKSAVTH